MMRRGAVPGEQVGDGGGPAAAGDPGSGMMTMRGSQGRGSGLAPRACRSRVAGRGPVGGHLPGLAFRVSVRQGSLTSETSGGARRFWGPYGVI